jgi:hypothetical protein
MAVVHRESSKLAVWCLAMTGPSSVEAVNAVVLDADECARVEGILHRQVVVGRVEDMPEGLPARSVRSVDDVVEALRAATDELRQEIVAAIASHDKRNRTRLVRPDWVCRQPGELGALPTDLARRTLAQANLVKARWQEWLDAEKQRLRRSRSPRTGESPYIMPAELSMLNARPLPPSLGVDDLVVPTPKVSDVAVDE